ncbi:MAG TPA: hypothetical protein VG796_19940 [Verrucomicrobiales bacterium]|nr:hypothetical protein [Verrucomicrobiales bacterium]
MNKNRCSLVSRKAMRMFVLFLVALTAPFLASCASSRNPFEAGRLAEKQEKKAARSQSHGLAGTTGQAGSAGLAGSGQEETAATTPFAPGYVPPSAKYNGSKNYWGWGGAFSRTKTGQGYGSDENNFLRENLYCPWAYTHCGYGRSYRSCNSGYRSCYTPSYRSCYGGGYSSRYYCR